MISIFPTDYNNDLNPEFNADDFSHADKYVTQGELLSYANLNSINIFNALNYFVDLVADSLSSTVFTFSNTINGINATTFNYIANLTSDAQIQITNTLTQITNTQTQLSTLTTATSGLIFLSGSTSHTITAPFYAVYQIDNYTSDITVQLPRLLSVSKGLQLTFIIPNNRNSYTV